MLTSRAREMLGGVEAVIVDEIHAVAATKRGAHLALTLERLEALCSDGTRTLQRIGLSATQRPLEEVARFLVGPTRERDDRRRRRAQAARPEIHVPVESMVEPDRERRSRRSTRSSRWPAARRRARSIWPAIYPELLELVRDAPLDDRLRQQPPRGRAARAAAQRARGRATGEDAPAEIARAHHGSLAREERTTVEELLKAGRAAVPGRDLARSSSASTWAPSTS